MSEKDKWTAEEIYNEILEPSFPKKLDNVNVFLSKDYVEKNYVRKEEIGKIVDKFTFLYWSNGIIHIPESKEKLKIELGLSNQEENK